VEESWDLSDAPGSRSSKNQFGFGAGLRAHNSEDRLDDVRRSVPALVSLSLSEEQSAIVATLGLDSLHPTVFFLAKNSLMKPEKEPVSPINPASLSFVQGETNHPEGSGSHTSCPGSS